ncbi:hypothetical protein [Pedobacter steynii]|uniref:Uncharacterized protein n=1 Tax=Pedobacter steynii TaxID=430522 RepID=A0A1D7QBQ0_9SPHI|nr:hypothetical protein [Pedobacter steynii]AOM75994.1 hypothetical protein BFS30_01735 [Pedobacter steynii]
MADISAITDVYIDEIIQATATYNPALKETQGIKLRELIKRLRDHAEQASLHRFFTYTTSGNGVLTQFSVPHGLPAATTAIVFPNSPDAIGRAMDVNTDPASASDLYAYIEGPNVIIKSRQTVNPFAAGINNLTWSLLVR